MISMHSPIDMIYIDLIKVDITEEDVRMSEIRHKLHHHNAYEIMFLLDSDNDIFIKDSKYSMMSRQIIFIPPYTMHRVFYHPSTTYSRYVLQFEHDFIYNLLCAVKGEHILSKLYGGEIPVLTFAAPHYMRACTLFSNLLKAYKTYSQRNAKDDRIRLQLALAAALLDIHDIISSNTADEPRKSSPLVKDTISYINNNYMNPITVNQIADALYVSKYHLCHRFKEATGESIIVFLQHARITQALKLLTEEGLSITETCFRCGFNSVQHFYGVFKKLTNSTPGKYIRKQR